MCGASPGFRAWRNRRGRVTGESGALRGDGQWRAMAGLESAFSAMDRFMMLFGFCTTLYGLVHVVTRLLGKGGDGSCRGGVKLLLGVARERFEGLLVKRIGW